MNVQPCYGNHMKHRPSVADILDRKITINVVDIGANPIDGAPPYKAMLDHCYSSFDLALRCILVLEDRRELPRGSQQSYLELLSRRT